MSLHTSKRGLPAPHLSSRPPVHLSSRPLVIPASRPLVIPASEPGSSVGWCTWTPEQVRGDISVVIRGDSHWVRGDSHWVRGDSHWVRGDKTCC
jgi:hypothetical protein